MADRTTTAANKTSNIATLKPFRLVKFFSFTSLAVILFSTLILSWITSNYAQKVLLERSEAYAFLLAENLNNQVFRQFVLPTALRYGEIALSNPKQFERLDTVVRNTTHALRVDSVTIFDSNENIISYSTIAEEVGKKDVGGSAYQKALTGESSLLLESNGTLFNLLPGSSPISCKLKAYIPFRSEKSLPGDREIIMGVTEIVQDLSDDLQAIIRLQGTIIVTSIIIMGGLFAALRLIVARADRIIEARSEERRRLEEKLHHSERLASLGKMVTAVSHEIKNPLGIVRSTAEILEKRLTEVAPTNVHLANIIIEETTRLDGIVMEFLDFARPQVPNLTVASINELLQKLGHFMQSEFKKHNIELITELDPQLESKKIDPNLLYRSFLNIMINAVHAMPDGGVLTVTSRQNKQNSGEIIITISDTGTGMSKEKQKRIFNPFYTDKIRGTGLGLAIAQNIIDGHHGSIEVDSEEGKGTTFTITMAPH